MRDVLVLLDEADRQSARASVLDLPIDIEVSGLEGSETVAAAADPGEVRGAVEKALRRLGLAAIVR